MMWTAYVDRRGCIVYARRKVQTELRARYVVFLAPSCRVTHLLAHKFYWIFWCAMVT